ncbi:uncharacterized protein DS421_5g165550 [Arachis hypogaea]|nr:uncharacterized protein DS421_5g165550 [Arachis hypogaea]
MKQGISDNNLHQLQQARPTPTFINPYVCHQFISFFSSILVSSVNFLLDEAVTATSKTPLDSLR